MNDRFELVSPIDGQVLVSRAYASDAELDGVLDEAVEAQRSWRARSLDHRIEVVSSFVAAFVSTRDAAAAELSQQMGRPIRYAPGEIAGFEDRAVTMLGLAESALEPIVPPPRDGYERFICREPLGTVLVLAPWNYPYLCAVNAIVPALVAGNTVVLKHSEQTALCGERLAACSSAAGLPQGLFQSVHATHDQVARLVADRRTGFVCFTGSVEGGQAVVRAASSRFVGVGLELGGKDPAYVRADADLAFAVENLADGAFFNSGQSCCGVERIYVDHSLYSAFLDGFVEAAGALELGDPRLEETTLGPMVRRANAQRVRQQIDAATASGAKALVDSKAFAADDGQGAYLAPQVLIDTDPEMEVVAEETFGPVVTVTPVDGDEQAIAHMNRSRYGLTASLWTRDVEVATSIGVRLETGTVFMNRCDFLDPELAWTGVKDSGRGCTLSVLGYEPLTRPKSFHLRLLV